MVGGLVAMAVCTLALAGCSGTTPAGGSTPSVPTPAGSGSPSAPATGPITAPTTGPSDWPTPTTTIKPRPGRAALDIVTQIGEQCPHRPPVYDPRCDPVPRPNTSYTVRSGDGAVVAEGRTGADGHAHVMVDAGTYLVRGELVSGYQSAPERGVAVIVGAAELVPLTYTTGIQ